MGRKRKVRVRRGGGLGEKKLTKGVLRRVVRWVGCWWETIGSFQREEKERENDDSNQLR